jgi:hypothetical protein
MKSFVLASVLGLGSMVALPALFSVACGGSAESMTSTITYPPADAGPDAVPVVLDGGGPVAVPPNGAAACPAGACNYQTGASCTGATSSCLPVISGAETVPQCTAPGTVAAGGACVAITDCVAGHACVGDVCRKLCCGGDWTGCDSASDHCIETLSLVTDAGVFATGANVCLPIDTCNALDPSVCTPAGTSCVIVDGTGATACVVAGTGQAGAPCPCAGGFTCLVGPSGPTCIRLCAAVVGGGSPYCAANESICTHYNRDPPGVGECALQQ